MSPQSKKLQFEHTTASPNPNRSFLAHDFLKQSSSPIRPPPYLSLLLSLTFSTFNHVVYIYLIISLICVLRVGTCGVATTRCGAGRKRRTPSSETKIGSSSKPPRAIASPKSTARSTPSSKVQIIIIHIPFSIFNPNHILGWATTITGSPDEAQILLDDIYSKQMLITERNASLVEQRAALRRCETQLESLRYYYFFTKINRGR